MNDKTRSYYDYTLSEESVDILVNKDETKWLPRLQALDNLIALFSLSRHKNVFGGGLLLFHPDRPMKTSWVSLKDSEELWLSAAKQLIESKN